MKKTIATLLAVLMALCAPGFGSYAAAGQAMASRGTARPLTVAVVGNVTPVGLGAAQGLYPAAISLPAIPGAANAPAGVAALAAPPAAVPRAAEAAQGASPAALAQAQAATAAGASHNEPVNVFDGALAGKAASDDMLIETAGVITQGPAGKLGSSSDKRQPQQGRGAVAEILSLPRSFLLGFTPGWTVSSIGQEIQAVALPLFTAELFDAPTALMVTGAGYIFRVAGAWLGSSLMKRFNPVQVNNVALLSVAVAGAALAPAGLLQVSGGLIFIFLLANSMMKRFNLLQVNKGAFVSMAGAGAALTLAGFMQASSGGVFALLLANSIVGGLSYGVTRGVAENLLPRMILGAEGAPKLELALNFAYQWVELGSIAAALWVAVPLLHLVGGPWMMAISSGLVGLATVFYATIRFAEPWMKPQPAADGAAAPSAPTPSPESALGFRDYAPVVFFRFMHFMMYGVLATLLALSVFHSGAAAGLTIGVYDGGSWLFSLLASLSLLPKSLGRRSSVALGAAAATAFLWSAAALPFLPLTAALGGLLGGLITVITNKWMPYYSKNLPEDKYRELSKWIMTWSILGLLPVFVVVTAIRLLPAVAAVISMQALLVGIAVVVTAMAGVLVYATLSDKRPE